MVADLRHLLDAGTGVAQKLDRGPSPEGPLLGQVEVEQVPAGVAGGGAVRVRGADEHRIAYVEGSARLYGEKGLRLARPERMEELELFQAESSRTGNRR